ncbi:MAG: methyltransferase domain-containing protein, partial [Actinobacteria bacterium]|nr:methyltransferase domain-containing protein [Actinomycetota bacterium]
HEAGIDEAQLPEGSFDTVVATFVLCSVPDQATALARMRSLLKPDGRLLFLEHVRGLGVRRRLQRFVAPMWRKGAGGCDPTRDTVAAIRQAGFTIAECDRFLLPRTWPVVRPAAQGVAYPKAAA